jgi:hypothetical protein
MEAIGGWLEKVSALYPALGGLASWVVMVLADFLLAQEVILEAQREY